MGVEKIGTHSSYIANVISDVVGDNRRVSRIVFGNTELHFADNIRTDISSLGENTTSGFGKQSQ